MNLKNRKYLLFTIWLLLVLSAPYTVLQNTPWTEANSETVLLVNFLQRVSGLLAFILISIQVVLGHWMSKFTQIGGAKAFNWHIVQGIFTFLLVLFHPFLYSVITYQTSNSLLNAILVITPSLKNQSEIYLTYGKLSFLLITITVITGYFRSKPFFRRHWLKFHILNYFVFYSVFIHMRIGSDIMTPPFVWISWLALALVSYSALEKFLFPFVRKIAFQNADEIQKQKA